MEVNCGSCVHGFNVYQTSWQAYASEILCCTPQANNVHDHYAVGVCKGDENRTVVGHIPKKILRICWLFLKKEGCKIICIVNDANRWYSSDLQQGGLEIPCLLKFIGTPENIQKAFILLKDVENKDNSVSVN